MGTKTYRPQADDTTEEVDRLLMDQYRRMTPVEKGRRLVEDCRALETLAVAGIRARHPGASDEEIRVRLAEIRLGHQLAGAVYRDHGWARGR